MGTEELQRADQEDVIVLRGPKKEKKVIKVMEETEDIPQEEYVRKKKIIKKVTKHKGLEDSETEEVEEFQVIESDEMNLEPVNITNEMEQAVIFKPRVHEDIQEPEEVTIKLKPKIRKSIVKEVTEEEVEIKMPVPEEYTSEEITSDVRIKIKSKPKYQVHEEMAEMSTTSRKDEDDGEIFEEAREELIQPDTRVDGKVTIKSKKVIKKKLQTPRDKEKDEEDTEVSIKFG